MINVLLIDANGAEERREVSLSWLLSLVRAYVEGSKKFTIQTNGGTIEVEGSAEKAC